MPQLFRGTQHFSTYAGTAPHMDPRLIDGDRWYKDNQHVYYEDRTVVPEARLDSCLQWAHLSSGHTSYNRSVDFFKECFYSRLTCIELSSQM